MNSKRSFIAIGLCFTIVMAFFLCGSKPSSALECYIVKILPGSAEQPITIQPGMLMIREGDCAVWFNASKELIKITFKGSGDKCANPVGFFKTKECFVSSWYGTGETTSMRLMEKGTYEYAITIKHKEVTEVIGKIEVK